MPTDPDIASGEQDVTTAGEGEERAALLKLAETLTARRPLPAPGFRSSVRRRLFSGNIQRHPSRLRVLISGYALAGVLLLGVATLGLAGLGPFAAG